LDVRVRSVRPRAGDLCPLTEGLVVGARTILRQRARLSVHLHGAFALIFERRDHVALIMALEHAHAPHPVEEHGLQVFGVPCGCVGFSRPRIWIRILRSGRQGHADREDERERDPGPTTRSTNIHGVPSHWRMTPWPGIFALSMPI